MSFYIHSRNDADLFYSTILNRPKFFAYSAAKKFDFINIFNKYKRKYGDISSR